MRWKQKARVAAVIVLAVVSAPVFVRAYSINGPSMAPTLRLGDPVIALQTAYDLRLPFTSHVLFRTGEPGRGDVVVYHDLVKECLAIKRIVGLPGDTIELRENLLFLNGTAVEQSEAPGAVGERVPEGNRGGSVVVTEQIAGRSHRITYTPGVCDLADHGPTTVPEGRYFLLGDHRDNSQDSRYIGCIAREQLRGRVVWGLRQ